LIEVSGCGNYEYSIVSANGPFQDSNFFDNIHFDTSTAYVRDKNGCGNAEYRIRQLSSNIFPSFLHLIQMVFMIFGNTNLKVVMIL